MSPRNQSNKNTIEGELKSLLNSFNSFKHRMNLSLSSRTYGEMVRCFNSRAYSISNKKPIEFKDLESFYQTKQQIIKDKYACKKYIGFDDINNQNGESLQNPSPLTNESILGESYSNSEMECSSWISKYTNQRADLITDVCDQPLAAKELFDGITKEHKGQLLLAPPGIGKTFILGSVIKNFIEQKWINKLNCISPWPILYVTKSSVVAQTIDVLKNQFGIDTVNTVRVINIEHLRSEIGKLFVKETLSIINGVEHVNFKWNQYMHPCFIIWDECQILAREVSIQSRIACAVNDIWDDFKATVYQIDASATPITRVCEGKHFACSSGKVFKLGGEDRLINNHSWRHFAIQLAAPAEPEEYSEEAIKRFMEFFTDRIVRVTKIKLKYKSYISTQQISFRTKEESLEYEKAWENYQKKKQKIEGDKSLTDSQSRFALLAQFTIFRKTAERIRRYHLADFIVRSWDAGKAPALGLGFKGTMTSVYSILVNDYGWNRNDVSFIWGGSTETLNTKQKLAKQIKDKGLEAILKGMNISMADLGLELTELNEKTEEQYQFEKEHNLLTQKPNQREIERLRFQRQESRVLLFSYKAGGVGLSAHHERQYPNSRQREGLFTPIYSEKEIIQAFGRLPRVTSISDTYQSVIYYGNTIEVDVMARLIMKLKCARHVSKNNDSWEDIVTGRALEEHNPINIPDEEAEEFEEQEQLLENVVII